MAYRDNLEAARTHLDELNRELTDVRSRLVDRDDLIARERALVAAIAADGTVMTGYCPHEALWRRCRRLLVFGVAAVGLEVAVLATLGLVPREVEGEQPSVNRCDHMPPVKREARRRAPLRPDSYDPLSDPEFEPGQPVADPWNVSPNFCSYSY